VQDDGNTTSSAGADIVAADLWGTARLGSSGGVTAYSVGTITCNIGDSRISWITHTNEHPVWFLNLYRLMDGRFEQIGMSWVAHGNFASSESFCGLCADPTDGNELGVGCSESADSFRIQSLLTPRSNVDAFSSNFDFPWQGSTPTSAIDRRLQVHDADLDPELNAGAMYFVEAQYITSDDATLNVGNNASYRRVKVVESSPEIYNLVFDVAWPTQVGEPAIRAWKDSDPAVVETDIQVSGEGLFILAAKATDVGDGFWHYEYALQNFNSHRSAGSLNLCFLSGLTLKNMVFHDVDYHSGEVYDLTDWTAEVAEGGVHWSTQGYAANPHANALRFGTIYNFRYDANLPPLGRASLRLGLFRPGNPQEIWTGTIGPLECINDYDVDRDGQSGCFDYCPNTPAGACICQGIGWCCLGCTGPCYKETPRDECVAYYGTPDECGDPTCKNGCPLLDMDNDADRDLADFAGLQRCFSGYQANPKYAAPSRECIHRLDVNDDGAIDLLDYEQLFELDLLGP
jgi:hypothetical protein